MKTPKFDLFEAANELEDDIQLKCSNFLSHVKEYIEALEKENSALGDLADEYNDKIERQEDDIKSLESRVKFLKAENERLRKGEL